jgi:hypothetical protein
MFSKVSKGDGGVGSGSGSGSGAGSGDPTGLEFPTLPWLWDVDDATVLARNGLT